MPITAILAMTNAVVYAGLVACDPYPGRCHAGRNMHASHAGLARQADQGKHHFSSRLGLATGSSRPSFITSAAALGGLIK